MSCIFAPQAAFCQSVKLQVYFWVQYKVLVLIFMTRGWVIRPLPVYDCLSYQIWQKRHAVDSICQGTTLLCHGARLLGSSPLRSEVSSIPLGIFQVSQNLAVPWSLRVPQDQGDLAMAPLLWLTSSFLAPVFFSIVFFLVRVFIHLLVSFFN